MDENCNSGSVHLCQDAKMPKKFQLELLGTVSVVRVDQKHPRWDANKQYKFDCGAAVAKNIYELNAVDSSPNGYVTNATAKQPPKELQMEIYAEANDRQSRTRSYQPPVARPSESYG